MEAAARGELNTKSRAVEIRSADAATSGTTDVIVPINVETATAGNAQ